MAAYWSVVLDVGGSPYNSTTWRRTVSNVSDTRLSPIPRSSSQYPSRLNSFLYVGDIPISTGTLRYTGRQYNIDSAMKGIPCWELRDGPKGVSGLPERKIVNDEFQ